MSRFDANVHKLFYQLCITRKNLENHTCQNYFDIGDKQNIRKYLFFKNYAWIVSKMRIFPSNLCVSALL